MGKLISDEISLFPFRARKGKTKRVTRLTNYNIKKERRKTDRSFYCIYLTPFEKVVSLQMKMNNIRKKKEEEAGASVFVHLCLCVWSSFCPFPLFPYLQFSPLLLSHLFHFQNIILLYQLLHVFFCYSFTFIIFTQPLLNLDVRN